MLGPYLDELDCQGRLADTAGAEHDDLVLPHPRVSRFGHFALKKMRPQLGNELKPFWVCSIFVNKGLHHIKGDSKIASGILTSKINLYLKQNKHFLAESSL